MKINDSTILLIVLGIMIAATAITLVIIPEAKSESQSFNQTAYTCNYLSNETHQFFYCERR